MIWHPRVYTCHGTVLCADYVSGTAIHVDAQHLGTLLALASHKNGWRFLFWHDGSMGTVICRPDGVSLVKGMEPAERERAGTKFDRIDLGGRRFAFQSNGLFLSAEMDGRIVCDRTTPQDWETFWVYGSDVDVRHEPTFHLDITSDVTVVVTSCGRQDLLERTMDSFLKYNRYPISKYIIVEDSGDVSMNDQ